MDNDNIYLKPPTGDPISYQLLQKILLEIRAYDHPIRQRIIEFLRIHGVKNVTSIWTKLKLHNQSVGSQHLRILKDAGFVKCVRSGKHMYYSLTDKIDLFTQFLELFSDDALEVNTTEAHNLFRTLRNRSKIRLINFVESEDIETVKDIYLQLRLEQSQVSLMLRQLRVNNVVHRQEIGRRKKYSVNWQRVQSAVNLYENVVNISHLSAELV